MPVARQSLRITEGYRRDLRTLVYRVKVDARKSWRKLDWNNLDRSFLPIHLGLINNVRAAQTQAVRLTAGYLGAYMSSELGEHVPPPSLPSQRYVGKSFTDENLDEALRSPLIKVKVANKEGQPDPMGTGLKAMLATVDLNVKTAARQSLQDAMVADDRITGWRRAVRGTCDACMGAADGSTLPPGTPLEVHPNCECVSEAAVVPQKAWEWADGQERFGIETPVEVERLGIEPGTQAAAAARAYTTGAYQDLNRRLVAGEALTPEQEAIVGALRKAMGPIPEATVWRGIKGIGPIGASDAETFKLLGRWAEEKFAPGSIVDMKGLQSCTFDTQPALDAGLTSKSPGLFLEILAKNGTYLGKVSEFSDEAELLLNEGKFQVRKVLKNVEVQDRDGETRHRVVIQLIQL